MSDRQKKALEIAIRDAMDGMEALASMFSYRRLPDDLEILGIDEESDFPQEPSLPTIMAEVISLAEYRRPQKTAEPPSRLPFKLKTLKK